MSDDLKIQALELLKRMNEAFDRAMQPPVIEAKWNENQPDIKQSLKSVADAVSKVGPGTATLIPSGSSFTFAVDPAVVDLADMARRLAWLLGLSNQEYAFVTDCAGLASARKPEDYYSTLSVFADWLEDQGRTINGAEIRRLIPQTGDVILCVVSEREFKADPNLTAIRQHAVDLKESLKKLNRDVLVVICGKGIDLANMSVNDIDTTPWGYAEAVKPARHAERRRCMDSICDGCRNGLNYNPDTETHEWPDCYRPCQATAIRNLPPV